MVDLSARRWSRALHLALGLILAVEGSLTLRHALFAHEDLHFRAFAAIQWVGALLFIWPRTLQVGGCILACVYLIAAVVHGLRGEFSAEHLVYTVAVLTVMIHGGGWSSSGQAAA